MERLSKMAAAILLFTLFAISSHETKGSRHPSICYDVYGCFTNAFPFNRTHIPLPESPSAINTRFLLFTRRTSWQGEWVDNIEALKRSQFNASRTTIFIIHGFAGFTAKTSIIQESDWWGLPMKNSLLWKGDFNVIIIDWMRGAWFPFTRAIANARLVGSQGAYYIRSLEEFYGRRLPHIHIIGFSFGAHVAGYIGRRMREQGRLIERITGLDPAAMWFAGEHADVRLDPSDAFFVDVIHTSSTYGITAHIGHVDFYPNGGKKQPGCNSVLAGFTNYLFCSHKRAPEFFTKSIMSSCPMYGYPCSSEVDFKDGKCLDCNGSCITMGYDAFATSKNGTLRNNFYLVTGAEAPYCAHHYEISFKTMNSWFAGVYGPVSVKLKGQNGRSHIVKSMKYIPGCTEVKFLYISPIDLGPLKRVTVWHHGYFQSWGLDRIIVRPAWTQDRYVAHPKTWLRYAVKHSKHLLTWKKDIRRQKRQAAKIAARKKRRRN